MSSEEKEGFDFFEFCTALLLGLTAIGAALSGLQAGQWGGKQLEAFSQSNAITTKATKEYNTSIASMNADYAIIAQAKRLLVEAASTEDETEQQVKLALVSYLYTQQLNWEAQKALGLPKEVWSENEQEASQPKDAAKPQAAPEAANTAEGEDAIDAALKSTLPEEVLWGTIDVELHDEDSTYDDEIFSEAEKLFAESEQKFAEGQKANENGDQFDLVGVYYTVALFFAGLGVVFKSGVRWGFFLVSLGGFGWSSFLMTQLPWAS